MTDIQGECICLEKSVTLGQLVDIFRRMESHITTAHVDVQPQISEATNSTMVARMLAANQYRVATWDVECQKCRNI